MAYKLQRASLGRIAAYSSAPETNVTTAFNTGDWFAPTGGTLSVSSGNLRWAQSTTGASRGVMHTAIADAADSFVQMVWAGSAGAVQRVGMIARGASGTTLPTNMLFSRRPGASNPSNQVGQLAEFNSSTVQSASTGNIQAAPPHRMNMWVNGVSLCRFRDFSSVNTLNLPGDITTVTAARKCGIIYSHDAGSGTITVDVSGYYRMATAILTVNGPSDEDWTIVVMDASNNVLASAAAVAGVATLDLDAAAIIFPNARKIGVIPDGEVTPEAVETPVEAVWGGDVWDLLVIPDVPAEPDVDNPTSDSLDVSWDPVADADSYVAERALAPEGPWAEVFDGAGTSFTDSGLDPLTTYYYRVQACNSDGCSDFSDPGSGTTSAPGVPGVPAEPDVENPTPHTLTVSWLSVDDATYYEVQRALSALGPWTTIGMTSNLSLLDSGLTESTEYFYRVAACNSLGCSAFSDVASGITLSATPTFDGRGYRLRIRNASTETDPNGTADALVITSLRGGTNPFIAAPPEGDGQEVDLLSGQLRTGSYNIRVIDAIQGDDSYGTYRIVTSKLEDASFRQQLLSRRAYIEYTDDEGDNWTTLIAGFITSIRLTSAIAYNFAIGDTRRIETVRKVFTWSAQPGPTGVSERDRFPNRGALAGGPIIGGFGPQLDSGGDEFEAQNTDNWGPNGEKFIGLKFKASYLPPAYSRSTNSVFYGQFIEQKVLQPFAETANSWPQVPFSGPQASEYVIVLDESGWREYPRVAVQITDGTTIWYGWLRAFVAGATTAMSMMGVVLDAASSVSPPTPGADVRVRLYQTEVSNFSPLYIDLHPVDIVTGLLDVIGYTWNAASATAVKAALGNNLRYAMRITEAKPMLEFLTRSIFGPFGFNIRNNADGEQEFFLTRPQSDTTPALTINTAALRSDEPPIFNLEEQSVVSSFRISYLTLSKTNAPATANPPPPPDGIVTSRNEVVLQNADVSVFSTREVVYEFEGMVHLSGSWSPYMEQLIAAIANQGFDRYGRGAPYMEVALLENHPAAAAKLGDEVYLTAAHYPNRGYRIGESSVGARIAQVVRRTESSSGPNLKLVDSGLDLQPVSPTAQISIDDSTSAPRTVAEFTIDNAALINAGNVLTLAVEWAVSDTEPTGAGVLFNRYLPGTVPTGAVPLPSVNPASTVWVRARTEQLGRRPSAWTDWESVTLGVFDGPTGLTLDEITEESVAAEWTPSNPQFWTDIFIAPGDTAPSDWTPYRIQRLAPGSNRAVIRGLAAATDYVVGVAHVDLTSGFQTAVASDDFTTAANPEEAPTPLGLQVLQLEEDVELPCGIAVAMWAADEVFNFEIQRASDVAGVPGVFTTIASPVPGTTQVYRDLLPSDGLRRWYRIRHVLPGYDPSPWTAAQSATPGGLPETINRPTLAPILNVFVTPGSPDYTITWAGTGTVELSIDGGSFGAPPTSPITVPVTSVDQDYHFRATLNGITVEAHAIIPANPALIPELTSASIVEAVIMDCGVQWEIDITWTCDIQNDAEYEVQIWDDIADTLVVAAQTTAGDTYRHVRGDVGDPDLTGAAHDARYRLEIRRLSDNTLMDSMVTNLISRETGPSC